MVDQILYICTRFWNRTLAQLGLGFRSLNQFTRAWRYGVVSKPVFRAYFFRRDVKIMKQSLTIPAAELRRRVIGAGVELTMRRSDRKYSSRDEGAPNGECAKGFQIRELFCSGSCARLRRCCGRATGPMWASPGQRSASEEASAAGRVPSFPTLHIRHGTLPRADRIGLQSTRRIKYLSIYI